MERRCRVGIDVGGTFTDFVLIDPQLGRMVTWKEPSSTADPARSVIAGFDRLLAEAKVGPDAIETVVHSTTLALNAILQQRGGKVGLVVSRGFGDIMVLARGSLPNSYNYKDPKRESIPHRRFVYEIPARLRTDGTRIETPSQADIDAVIARARADGLEALAVVVLNSYAHPALEIEIADRLAAGLPGVLVTASASIWPEVREYERALVAVLNGYIHPMMDRYYAALDAHFAGMGLASRLQIAVSNGGTVGVATARRRPIDTLLSGPAAGVAAGSRVTAQARIGQVVSVDMGGTSSDMAIILDGRPEFTTETRIGSLPVIVPAVNVWAIGAGGGSIVWVDEQGLLKVGPQSAGADPGPVCYGRGGTQPTITDCYVALGFIDPMHFVGGRMRLDRQAAVAALAGLGSRIGLIGAGEVAEAALRIATAKMATEIAKGMAQRGYDPASFTLLPYGGAGPTHAGMLADAAGLDSIFVPVSPGTFCAQGAVTGQLKRDFARSRRMTLGVDTDAGDAFRAALADLQAEARAWIVEEGHGASDAATAFFADMQYPKTAVELTVELPADVAAGGDPARLAECFHLEHERLYGFRDAASPVYLTTVRITASAAAPDLRLPRRAAVEAVRPAEARSLTWRGETLTAQVFHADALGSGTRLSGPAVVEMPDSTVIVPPSWQLDCNADGSLHLTRQAKGH